MQKQLANSKFDRILFFVIIAGLISSSCAPAPAAAAPAPEPTPCSPPGNTYSTSIGQDLISIYERGVASIGDETAYNNVRQQAFNELFNRVYFFSDSVDLQSGEKTYRITITYISPELAHAIIVNHYLYRKYTNFSGSLSEQIPSHMSKIVGRNEYVFFMTVMSSAYADGTTNILKIPLKQLGLTNTNNSNIKPAHDDHILETPITLNNGPKYGFFYYPMAVIQNGACQAVLDKNYDTRIMLSVPNIVINDTDMGPHSWEYKYAPLIDMTSVSGIHQNKFSVGLFADQYTPGTITLTPMNIEIPDYWIALARIIWLETTLDT